MKMPYPRKNGKSTLCINNIIKDIMKLEEYIADLTKEIGYDNLTVEDFFCKGGEIHIDWSLEKGDKE